jgi:hypothetical protein
LFVTIPQRRHGAIPGGHIGFRRAGIRIAAEHASPWFRAAANSIGTDAEEECLRLVAPVPLPSNQALTDYLG